MSSESEPPQEETALQRFAFAPVFRGRARLTWKDMRGAREAFVDHRVIVGSAVAAGLTIADASVSRLHAELEVRDDGLWVRDLGSRNGTFVEGIQVAGAKIPERGRLRFGAAELVVSYGVEKRPVELWPRGTFGKLVGESLPMRELFATLARIAPLDASVHITGETGTGKELVARAIHEASSRAHKPFIVLDCGALPESLLDAELFGHAKGAFTGAIGSRLGAIEAAEGGTVFLDEIGELPIAMQPKLLRVLESRVVRRVGEATHRPVDVRFISATHRDLLTMVNAGDFREDLYFRLAVLPVSIPPLRDRREDIELLVDRFWSASGEETRVSPELTRVLAARPWRGNVRELRNFVERARALGATQALAMMQSTDDVPVATAPETSPPRPADPVPNSGEASAPPLALSTADAAKIYAQSYRDFREAWVDAGEKEYVQRLLHRHDRNVSAAAREAGVDRTYIYRLIRKHDL